MRKTWSPTWPVSAPSCAVRLEAVWVGGWVGLDTACAGGASVLPRGPADHPTQPPLLDSPPPQRPAGVKKRRTGLANELGVIAGHAFRARRPPASSFVAGCELVADLAAAAAAGEVDRGAVLRLALDSWFLPYGLLRGQRDAAQLRAVFAALQQHLGWSAQQAGAALLGLGLQAGPDGRRRPSAEDAPQLQLLDTTAQHIERMGRMLR